MSDQDPIREGKTRSRLPLNDDDLRVGGMGQDVNSVSLIEGLSYQKLFLTIVLAAPFAAVLAMIATDIYSNIAKRIGLRSEPQIVAQPPVAAAKEDEALKTAIDGLVKANKNIAATVEKHTAALARLAAKEQAPQTKEAPAPKAQKAETTPPAKEAAKQETKSEKPVAQAEKGKPSPADARKKVEELSGVDIGKPVKSFKPFESMKSRQMLKETSDALDAIIANSKPDDTLRKNAEKAKQIVNGKLASLDKKQR
ncbi:MAG: hypothetical protein HQK86_12055 [Nitrospinae bacterium]|nr:hypothetical protein [Nitrospinota bacterium]